MAQAGANKTIRQLREEQGWTQQELAQRVGASQGAVSLWEHGVRQPYRRTRLRLAELFGIRVEDIALGPAEQHPHAGTRQERP